MTKSRYNAMSITIAKTVISLINNGWRLYPSEPKRTLYERISCPYAQEKSRAEPDNGCGGGDARRIRSRKKPCWFVRDEIYFCISCKSFCMLAHPNEFWPMLQINYQNRALPDKGFGGGDAARIPKKIKEAFSLTPEEIVTRKSLLRVNEAAYCLDVNTRTIYKMIEEGKLRKLKEKPVRISAEDVRERMKDFDD
jgi:excisionase family DNA binding protein